MGFSLAITVTSEASATPIGPFTPVRVASFALSSRFSRNSGSWNPKNQATLILATFFHHILNVFQLRSEKKMMWVSTRRGIAVMKNVWSFLRDFSINYLPHNAMNSLDPVFKPNFAVAPVIQSTFPEQAPRIGLRDMIIQYFMGLHRVEG